MTAVVSVLFANLEDQARAERAEAPCFFRDLNLDQVVESATFRRGEHRLEAFFSTPLRDVAAVEYRHEVFRDLEQAPVLAALRQFTEGMHTVQSRQAQAAKLHYQHQKQRWHLDAVDAYGDSLRRLAAGLDGAELRSKGLVALRDYLDDHVRSSRFVELVAAAEGIEQDLDAVSYSLLVRGSSVTVFRQDYETDYSAEVERTFEKFKQADAPAAERESFSFTSDINHIEAGVLERVAKLHPEVFDRLDAYCTTHADFVDETVACFWRETQFYLAWIDITERCREGGLALCWPEMDETTKQVRVVDGFDLALALKELGSGRRVLTNDIDLGDGERICVVSGPNQGGKSTYARMFGQIHYLASLGCPVPGLQARLGLFDHLFTHFERREEVANLRGKLQDDLVRIHDMLEVATARTVFVLNEIFSSTTLSDAAFLGVRVFERITDLGALCLCVTFVEELSSLGGQTVSMISMVDPSDPAVRTYKLARRPVDGLSYTVSMAERHGLTYAQLKERLAR